MGTLRCPSSEDGREVECLVNAESRGPRGGGGWYFADSSDFVSRENRLFHSL